MILQIVKKELYCPFLTFRKGSNSNQLLTMKISTNDLEMLPHKNGTFDCSATNYWYGFAKTSCN